MVNNHWLLWPQKKQNSLGREIEIIQILCHLMLCVMDDISMQYALHANYNLPLKLKRQRPLYI